MPEKVGSVINGALGAGLLEPAWVQRWFDGFFMLAVTITAVGILLRQEDWWWAVRRRSWLGSRRRDGQAVVMCYD